MHRVVDTGIVENQFFFFQAEDGIRDYKVTGVQTCALPILDELRDRWSDLEAGFRAARMVCAQRRWGFQVVDERYIRDDYLKNVTFLRDYRSYPSDGKSALMLLQTLQEQIGRATCRERV